ncbi:MAG: MBL fold metallo-hydrolase [Deltaproteobacteria bacterium]|nr:MBL fold metallo-hydrolase [Deltaproteobacteria bacterium]
MTDISPPIAVTILGSGTCVPSLRRSSCAVLMETGGKKLLFDAGAGTLRRMLECGVSIFDISCIFFSHFHPDHTAELVPFLFASKYSEQGPRKTPLTLIAGKGFSAFHQTLKQAYGTWIELDPGILSIVEMNTQGPDHLDFDLFSVNTRPAAHNPESISYRIASPSGYSVVYSGDTDYTDDLVTLAADTQVLICECSHPDEEKVRGHLTPSLAGNIAAAAGVKKLVLTHFYPRCDGFDIEKECRKTYNGELVLAEDLMRL